MTQPNTNSQGMQVWDPQVGVYFKPALTNRESFGGIVGALQDQMVATGLNVKAYPDSFAGIISAIQDLTIAAVTGPAAKADTNPGGGYIEINDQGVPHWVYTENPDDGELWFDTRQGRMFVAYQNEWYQSNGADGLPVVTQTATPPNLTNIVDGQYWWVVDTQDLYIFDGQYTLADGTITQDPNAGGTPVWVKITLDTSDYFQTTANLPLSDDFKVELAAVPAGQYLPIVNVATTENQKQANEYFLDCLESLNSELVDQTITMTESPPANPVAGQQWYDINDLEMSIWYVEPGDAVTEGQWVPISATYTFEQSIDDVNVALQQEMLDRTNADSSIQTIVDEQRYTTVPALSIRVSSLENNVTALQNDPIDLSPYAIESRMQTHLNNLQTQINTVNTSINDLDSTYVTDDALNTSVAALTLAIQARATEIELATVASTIPSIAGLATTNYVDSQVATTAGGIKAAGDNVLGTLVFKLANIGIPNLDFSDAYTEGTQAFKFKSNSTANTDTVTFGTTEQKYEYAWQFAANEDFCWIQNNTKVVSIASDGVAATNFKIADFGVNTDNGRTLTNTIDVKAKLTSYQTAFEQMRQGISDSTDYASLKTNLLSALQNV